MEPSTFQYFAIDLLPQCPYKAKNTPKRNILHLLSATTLNFSKKIIIPRLTFGTFILYVMVMAPSPF